MSSEVKNYVRINPDGSESGVYAGRAPRQAALKAANDGKGTKDKPEMIKLRERGTKKVHIFKGYKQIVDAPENRPAWMPEQINKPFVAKVGTEKPGKVVIPKLKVPEVAAKPPGAKSPAAKPAAAKKAGKKAAKK